VVALLVLADATTTPRGIVTSAKMSWTRDGCVMWWCCGCGLPLSPGLLSCPQITHQTFTKNSPNTPTRGSGKKKIRGRTASKKHLSGRAGSSRQWKRTMRMERKPGPCGVGCVLPSAFRSLPNPSSVCLLSEYGNSTKRYDHVKPRFAAVAAVPSSKHSRSCHLTPLQRESEARSFLLQLQAPTDAPRPITASNSFSTAPA